MPATVPGCVHLDLSAAGVINDPYVDRNELDVQWVGESAWTYRLSFASETNRKEENERRQNSMKMGTSSGNTASFHRS